MTIQSNVKTEKGVSNLKQAGKNFSDAAQSEANDYASKATDVANQLGNKVGEYVGDASKYLNEASRNAGKYLEQASSTVKDVSSEIETRVQDRPLTAIAATLGLGVILGMLLRK